MVFCRSLFPLYQVNLEVQTQFHGMGIARQPYGLLLVGYTCSSRMQAHQPTEGINLRMSSESQACQQACRRLSLTALHRRHDFIHQVIRWKEKYATDLPFTTSPAFPCFGRMQGISLAHGRRISPSYTKDFKAF